MLDEQDLEILNERFALNKVKTEAEFAEQQAMELTLQLNNLKMKEYDLQHGICSNRNAETHKEEQMASDRTELAFVLTEIQSLADRDETYETEVTKEQARMETLILDGKAKKKALEPKLIKLGLAQDRVKKYTDLIEFMDGEIAHFQAETEKLLPEVEQLIANTE